MKHTIKSQAYLIIVGAFVLGIVTGSLLMNLVTAKTTFPKKPAMIDELAEELQLSPEQKSKVEDIFRESRQQGKELYKTIQPQMDELRSSTKAKVKAVLNNNQQSRYESWSMKKDAERKKDGEKK
jgi:polyhydroxyalkanoate synthesis regulator phasin